MAVTPKTWTEAEIIQLIETEIIACREQRETPHQTAEAVYAALNDNSLIENTP